MTSLRFPFFFCKEGGTIPNKVTIVTSTKQLNHQEDVKVLTNTATKGLFYFTSSVRRAKH